MSATLLPSRLGRAVFDPWRAHTRARLAGLPPAHAQLLRHLMPPVGDFPDFLNPPAAMDGLEAGIDAVMSTPTARLRREVGLGPGSPSPVREIVEGKAGALKRLGAAMRDFYHAAVHPHWAPVQALVAADSAARARAMLHKGVDGLLASLQPTLRWEAPVLMARYPVERDLHLDGRGLTLVPSAFCWSAPVTLVDDDLPPVLVYPAVGQQPGWWLNPGRGRSDHALAQLLGANRAKALSVIEDGCTTGDLARRAGMSAPSASQHAAVLRGAGLITSVRHGNTVLHALTTLGVALLRNDAAGPPSAGG